MLPNSAVEADFDAGNLGLWMIHCHNVYHAEVGHDDHPRLRLGLITWGGACPPLPSIVTIDGRRSPQVAAAAVVSRRARVRAGSATARAERSAPVSLVRTWP